MKKKLHKRKGKKLKRKKNLNFLNVFLKRKNKHALIRKFNSISNEKKYHHPIFIQYKKLQKKVNKRKKN